MRESDFEWIKRLFNSYQRDAYIAALSITRNKADAEDAVAEAFMYLAANRPAKIYKSEKGLVCITARRKALDLVRRRGQIVPEDPQVLSEMLEGSEELDIKEADDSELMKQKLYSCLRKMKSEDFNLIHRFYLLKESPDLIAADFGITLNALYARNHKAKKRLKICLER